jgi:PST family polysaccharide transporter
MINGESAEISHEMQASSTQRSLDPAPVAPPKSEALGPRIFQNIVTLIGGQGLNLVLSGAATILLARYLGSEQLGTFGALYAYLGLYGWLTTFGLESILARHVAQDRERAGSILLTGVCLSSLFALGATATALAFAPTFGYSDPLRGLLIFASIDILMLSPLRLPGIIFQVDLRQWYGVGISLVRQFVWLLVLVVMATARAGLSWIIVGRTFCALLEVALIAVAIRHKGFLARPWRLLPTDAKRYLAYGFPIAVSTLAVGIYHRIDQVMLHKMVSDQVLGNYVAAVRLTEFVNLVPVAVMTSLFPILSQTAQDEDRFCHYLRLSFRALMAIAFGVCIVIALFAVPIVHLLYGVKFATAAPLLAVLIWSEVPVFFGVVIANGLVAKNLQNYLPLSTGIGAVVNVVMNLYLIPRWGAMGSAWATNVSELLAAVLLFLVFRPTRPIAWRGLKIAAVPCMLAILIVGTSSVLFPPTIFALPIVIACYGIGAWVTGVIQRSEIAQVWQLIGRSLVLSKSNTHNKPVG